MTSATYDQMTIHGARAELAHLTYKPGWTFRVTASDPLWAPDHLRLLVSAVLPDARNPGVTATVTAQFPIPPRLPITELLGWVRGMAITQLELHERDEWFLVDGQRIYDPHKEQS